ncbi:MAG: FMN-binding protein [Acholeplasmataceae bacterium]
MKKVLMIIGGVLLVLALGLTGGFIWATRGIDEAIASEIETVDLALVEDGEYEGSYENGRFTTTVWVKVEDHAITDARVVEDVRFEDATWFETLKSEVVNAGTLEVDPIAGATASSKAYLHAMADALSGVALDE